MIDNRPDTLVAEFKDLVLQQLPPQATLIADYYAFNRSRRSFEATIYYRYGDGPKRRMDFEWTLTGAGDVLATEPVPFD